MSAAARLTVRGLSCLRAERLLFEGLDLDARAGGALLVTGRNGAGKSSLLRMLAGLLPPAAGTIDRDGRIALAAEQPALDGERTLADALAFWAAIDGRPRRSGGMAVMDALAAMGLERIAPVPVRMLSTGQRRRALIARVIAGGAEIWLLDEPGNGLDTASLARLDDAMAAHRAAGGIVVVASHQPLGLADAREVRL